MEAKLPNTRNVVLVVEDEPFVRVLGVDLLEEAGFAVLEACNADEALSLLEAHPEVRAVFSDIDMPGSLNGLELARRIFQRWPRIGILLTSGHRVGAEVMPREGRFMPKPYDGRALVRQIEEFMV
jgi:two-component system, response regulator PdtaR